MQMMWCRYQEMLKWGFVDAINRLFIEMCCISGMRVIAGGLEDKAGASSRYVQRELSHNFEKLLILLAGSDCHWERRRFELVDSHDPGFLGIS